jgi:hypothetical protein
MVLNVRPSFLLSERPPVVGDDGTGAVSQPDTPPDRRQQVFPPGQVPVAAAIVRACSSVSTLAIPTVVQPALSSSSSRIIAASYSIDTGPTATRSFCPFRITRM